MRIRRIDYGLFPQIAVLNHRFRPDVPHLKVTLDVDFEGTGRAHFLRAYRMLTTIFPTLSHHSCCEQWENTPLFLEEVEDVSIKLVGEIADWAHLTEHVIVDLQVAITGLKVCSGVTCGHQEPQNRFDLFIECIDPRMGAFAAQYAADLVLRARAAQGLSPRHRQFVAVAREVALYPELGGRCAEIAARLELSEAVTQAALRRIAVWTEGKWERPTEAA